MRTIGIDLGGTTLSAGLVNHEGKIILRRTVDTEHSSGEAIIGQLCELVQSLCAGPASAEAVQVGIAIPGWVDAARGRVVTCPNIPLQGVSLAERLSSLLDCEVKIENDANCATLGEQRFGAAKACRNVVLLTLGYRTRRRRHGERAAAQRRRLHRVRAYAAGARRAALRMRQARVPRGLLLRNCIDPDGQRAQRRRIPPCQRGF